MESHRSRIRTTDAAKLQRVPFRLSHGYILKALSRLPDDAHKAAGLGACGFVLLGMRVCILGHDGAGARARKQRDDSNGGRSKVDGKAVKLHRENLSFLIFRSVTSHHFSPDRPLVLNRCFARIRTVPRFPSDSIALGVLIGCGEYKIASTGIRSNEATPKKSQRFRQIGSPFESSLADRSL